MVTAMADDERKIIHQRDLELIDEHVEELNREAEEVDCYQSPTVPGNLDRETFDLLVKVPISEEDLEP